MLYVANTASGSTFGVVKTDNATIGSSSGVISCITATTSQTGCVTPDGTTITIASGGVISAVSGSSASIYGDGSDTTTLGICSFGTTTNWATTDPGTEIQCTNFSLLSGQTLTVPSGTVIHATGTVSIAGTITVGNSPISPQGVLGWYAQVPNGYFGGVVLGSFQLRKLLHPGLIGGGGGYIPMAGAGTLGGIGGGTLVIAAGQGVTISGTITANGTPGTGDENSTSQGGGGGGIIIIASRNSVTNTGVINVQGGAGGNDFSGTYCASGGGGGGVVHLLGPSGLLTPGASGTNYFLTGGAAGDGTGQNNSCSGGGASGGNGGDTSLESGGTAQAGFAGLLLQTTVADPSTVFTP